MGLTINDIRESMRRFNATPLQSILGKVAEVDIDSRTCTVEDDGVDYYEVSLQACDGAGCGLLVIPKVGSEVLMIRVEDSDAMWSVIATNVIDKIDVVIEDTHIEISGKGITFNGGKNGGMVNVQALLKWQNSVYADLQKIAVALNGIGAAVVISSIVPVAEIEDTNIRH